MDIYAKIHCAVYIKLMHSKHFTVYIVLFYLKIILEIRKPKERENFVEDSASDRVFKDEQYLDISPKMEKESSLVA